MKIFQHLKKEFCNHLHGANESYLQHFTFTIKMGWEILVTALILIIHGFLPCFFTKTTSKRLDKINKIFVARLKTLEDNSQFNI